MAGAFAFEPATNQQVRLHIIVIQHTFGGRLNHYPHLHMMVSAGGLKPAEARWVEPLEFDRQQIMSLWRFAVTSYLWRIGMGCCGDLP
jgi:pyrroloquinoline quinone (PQQ) biosynthesis protein C